MVGAELADPRTGKNGRHAVTELFRQSVSGRLGGYEEDGVKILGAYFFFLFIGFKVAAWAGRTVAVTVWVGRAVAGVPDLINALCNAVCNALRLRPRLTKDLNR